MDASRLKLDPRARAELYLAEAEHDCDGDPLAKTLWRIAQRLAIVEDDFEGVDLAYYIQTGVRLCA